MEDGRLTDGHGRTVDFRNTLVLMTSNVGTTIVERPAVGFLRESSAVDEAFNRRSSVEEGLKNTFRPEFMNRIDEIVIFDPLTSEEIERIVGLVAGEVNERMQEHNITLSLTNAATAWLAKKGFDPVFGARPLRRVVQRFVETPLSKQLLSGDIVLGDHVEGDVGEEGLTFRRVECELADVVGS